ncbi:uncharacterized protein C10orf95-like [Phodopus roborovskii]|uniref:uncharacterized protein C10orf95-like n=1 Tax=Phodopus roborovskii TaxID=109678 RepID=UPI0021E3F243|nr:uncharacterized protein C10orf95-like [Phodopus roborovskii]
MVFPAPRTGSFGGRPAPLPRAPEVIWGGCCRAAGRRVGLPRAECRSPPPPPPRPPPPSGLLPRPARNSECSAERGPVGTAEAREPAGRAARGAGERPRAGEAGPRRGCVRRAWPAAAAMHVPPVARARTCLRPDSGRPLGKVTCITPVTPRAAPGRCPRPGAAAAAVPAPHSTPGLPRLQSTPCRYRAAAFQASPPGFGAS